MTLSYLFFFSGIMTAILLIAKRMEEKRKTDVFLLKLISRSDERVRNLHQEAVRHYSLFKERGHFLFFKQLPRYSRSSLNKALSKFEENMRRYLDRLRDSRLLKENEGISEFFKNMSEVEKGSGEIHENLVGEDSGFVIQDLSMNLAVPEQPIKAKPKRKYTRRKVKVVEVE